MKEIELTKGYTALVDDQDFERISKYNWCVGIVKTKNYSNIRAMRQAKRKTILMHRFLLGITDPNIHVDHIDHNSLNNQRSNLRICNRSQNCSNKRSSGLSKFLGVFKKRNKWISQIGKDGKIIYLGIFSNEEDAAKKYDNAAIKLHGSFANLNFKNHGE